MALPDDGRMDIADTITIGNAISAMMSPALVAASVGMNLVAAETFSTQSNVIKFRKSGSLVAEVVAQGAVYIPSDANSDINDTSVSCTSTKVAVASPISVEAMRFGAGAADVARIGAEQGRAIARKFDVDLVALFDSITNVSTATSTLDTDALMGGVYNLSAANCPPGPRAAILDPKGINELRKLVANSGAAIWSSQYSNPLFGTPTPNNFVGNFLGVDIYSLTGLLTTGGDRQGCLFDPRYGFCAGFGGSIESHVTWSGVGVASQVAGFSWIVDSHMFYDVKLYNDTCTSEIRSDS